MSEILTKHGRIIERLSMHNMIRFDRVAWPCDGHECPSYSTTLLASEILPLQTNRVIPLSTIAEKAVWSIVHDVFP